MLIRHHTKAQWAFTDMPSTAVYTSRDVIEQREPVLLVTHDQDDGTWQFCAGPTVPDKDARIAALAEIVCSDPSVIELADLPRGWIAVRGSITTPWQRHQVALNGRTVVIVAPRDSEADQDFSYDRGLSLEQPPGPGANASGSGN